MENPNILRVPLYIWLFTMITSPLILVLLFVRRLSLGINQLIETFPIIFPIMIIGAFISFPALFVYCSAYIKINKSNQTIFFKKFILCLIGLLLITLTLFIVFGQWIFTLNYDTYRFILAYFMPFVAFTIVYKMGDTQNGKKKFL